MSKYILWSTILFILIIAHILGMWLFYLSYFYQNNSIHSFSPKQNPYHSKMRFKDKDQEQIYKEQWFPTQSEQILLQVIDGFVIDWARDRQQQQNLQSRNEIYPNSYYQDVPFPEPIQRLLSEPNNTIFLEGFADGPTISAVRVKAFVKGNLPLHIEIVNNIRSIQLLDDNIVYQEKVNGQGKKVLFYGYYFWDSIVGQHFDRKHLTYYERLNIAILHDMKVSQLIEQEQENDDWSTCISHYEAIDIACHHYRSVDQSIFHTLSLHNDLLTQVVNNTKKSDTSNQTVIYLNDHGQNDQVRGMHGGYSLSETTVMVYAYDKRGFIQKSERDIGQVMDRDYLLNQPVNQIDITATYSMLRGIPLPAMNIGIIIPDFFINRIDLDNSFILNNYFVNVNQIYSYVQTLKQEFLKPITSFESLTKDLESISSRYHMNFDHLDKKGFIPTSDVKVFVEQCIKFARRVKSIFHQEVVGPNIFNSKCVIIYFSIVSLIFYITCIRISYEVNHFHLISDHYHHHHHNDYERDKIQYRDYNRMYLKSGIISLLFIFYLIQDYISSFHFFLLNALTYTFILINFVIKIQFRDIQFKTLFTFDRFYNSQLEGFIDGFLVLSCIIFNFSLRLSNEYYEKTYDLTQVFFLAFYAIWIVMVLFCKNLNKINKLSSIILLCALPIATNVCGYYSNLQGKKFNQLFIIDEFTQYFQSNQVKFYFPLLLFLAIYAYLVFRALKGIMGNKKWLKRIILGSLFAFQYFLLAKFYLYQSDHMITAVVQVEPIDLNVPSTSYVVFIITELFKIICIHRDPIYPPSFGWKYSTFIMNFVITSMYILHYQSMYQVSIFLLIIFSLGHISMKLNILNWASKFTFLFLLSQWYFYVSDHLERDEALHVEVFNIGLYFGGLFYPIFNGVRNTFFGQFLTSLFIPLIVIAEQYQRNTLNYNQFENQASFLDVIFSNSKCHIVFKEIVLKEVILQKQESNMNISKSQEKNYQNFINLNIRAYSYFLLPLIISYTGSALKMVILPIDSQIDKHYMPSFFYQSLFLLVFLIVFQIQYLLIRFNKSIESHNKTHNFTEIINEDYEQELQNTSKND